MHTFRHITGGLSTHSSQLEQGRLLPIDLTMGVPAIEITVTSQKRNEMESDYGVLMYLFCVK